MPSPAKKDNKINQIVCLKQVMRRWRRRCITSDSDTEQQLPSAGSLAVYVGPDRHRFVIPTRFLNLPVFLSLLNKAEEEFGFQTTGGLVIPSDVSFFKWLLNVLNRNQNGVSGLDLDDFMAMFSETEIDVTEHCKEAVNNCFTPLLEKARV
ncbi:protein SMALL AUXIN UP-REGULATED RNA 12-like [Bidens hawaiensis]|uniref:protein SMALL AUXIN UP-REGULATED RNA 12-like n=1 Tax=Bidens hawaiensis TaxID=980011 RepID=UPI00404ACC59